MLILKKGGTSLRSLACPYAHHKDIWGPEVQFHLFLNSTVHGHEWSALWPGRFISGKEPRYPPSKRLKPTCLNIQAPRRHGRNLVRVKWPSNIFHSWEEFFWPQTWRKAHKKCGENGEKGFMQTESRFKPIFLVFLIRLLRKLKLLIPMVDFHDVISRRSQWPCGLRRGSATPRLLRMWVWIPSGA